MLVGVTTVGSDPPCPELSTTLSRPSLNLVHHLNTDLLLRVSSPNCAFSLVWISDALVPSATRNFITTRCSTAKLTPLDAIFFITTYLSWNDAATLWLCRTLVA